MPKTKISYMKINNYIEMKRGKYKGLTGFTVRRLLSGKKKGYYVVYILNDAITVKYDSFKIISKEAYQNREEDTHKTALKKKLYITNGGYHVTKSIKNKRKIKCPKIKCPNCKHTFNIEK